MRKILVLFLLFAGSLQAQTSLSIKGNGVITFNAGSPATITILSVLSDSSVTANVILQGGVSSRQFDIRQLGNCNLNEGQGNFNMNNSLQYLPYQYFKITTTNFSGDSLIVNYQINK